VRLGPGLRTKGMLHVLPFRAFDRGWVCLVLATILFVVTAAVIVVIEGVRSALAALSRNGASTHEFLNGNIGRPEGDRLRMARLLEIQGR
jgi:hypothetical protein